MKKLDRRSFVIESARVGTALAGLSLVPASFRNNAVASEPTSSTAPSAKHAAAAARADISVVTGEDTFKSTLLAVEQLGGMGRFVNRGERVGLLCNTWGKKPGTYTSPEVTLAVAQLCYEAGAKQVYMVKNEDEGYWRRSKLSKKHERLISELKPDDSDHVTTKIPGAKVLKEAKVLEGPLRYDRLFNLPVIKDHSGVRMTCTLKNMMGLSSFTTNIGFHLGPTPLRSLLKSMSFVADHDYFAQCIADLNLVRTVDLCVVDATQFITTNGPSGPGELSTPHQVVAGTDRVAIDTLCCGYLDVKHSEIAMIRRAHERGLGEVDLAQLNITRTTA